MLKYAKNKLDNIKEKRKKQKEEFARITREKAEEEARIERERVQTEKDALVALSEKELLVEIIMALRGYNVRISNIEEQQDDLIDRVDSIELIVDSLDSNLSNVSSSVDELKHKEY